MEKHQDEPLKILYLAPSEIKVGERFRKDLGSLDDLKKSILEVGLLQPIGVTKEKVLVFGRRRLEAWKELWEDRSIACVTVDGDLYKFKIAELHENVKRKNMSWQEEVLAEEEIKQTYEKLYGWTKQGERTDLTFSSDEKVTIPKLAKELDISNGKLSQDLQLAETIKTHPEIKRAKTKKQALRKLKEEKKKQETNETLKIVALKVPDNVSLYQGEFLNVLETLPKETVSLILTDPPYGEEYLPLWEKLATFANEILVPSGFLVAYSGQYCLPRVFDALRTKLSYFWTIALILKEKQLVPSRNVFCEWKPLVVFYKPPLNMPSYFADTIKGEGKEKDLHKWQQAEPEIKKIIEIFCPEKGIICDPMAGSGTTLAVATKMGRKCIGIECYNDTFEAMKRRLGTIDV